MKRTCDTCKWWDYSGCGKGICRGAPPTSYRDADGDIETVWPETSGDDHCGAFRGRD